MTAGAGELNTHNHTDSQGKCQPPQTPDTTLCTAAQCTQYTHSSLHSVVVLKPSEQEPSSIAVFNGETTNEQLQLKEQQIN